MKRQLPQSQPAKRQDIKETPSVAVESLTNLLESLPAQVIKEQLLEPMFNQRDWDTLRQLRTSSKSLQKAVDTQDEQDYQAKLSRIKQIAVGAWHNLALMENGKVYGWGSSSFGQLGTGAKESHSQFLMLDLPLPAKQIAAGDIHSLVLLENGEVYTCGNVNGSEPMMGNTERLTAVPLSFPAPVKEIISGAYHNFAVLETNEVYTWGNNANAELGLGHREPRMVPEVLQLPAPVKNMVAGDYYSLALLENGECYCWGSKWDSPNLQVVEVYGLTPTLLKLSSPLTELVSYDCYHLLLLENGEIQVWNKNSGRMENPLAVVDAWRNQQAHLGLPGKVKQYISAVCHSAALLENGELYALCIQGFHPLAGLKAFGYGFQKVEHEFVENPLLEKTKAKVRVLGVRS